ncbi:MAG: peptidoglycan-binding domain-containing protein, partial [Candidatus Paceibacterota bacterium]
MSIDNISNKTVTAKVATAFVVGAMTIAVAFAFTAPKAHAALTEGQIDAILTLLNSFGADTATVSNVETSLRGGAPSGGSTGGTTGGTGFTFTQNLTLGDTGNEVMELQKFLNSDPSTQLGTAPDAGSPGNETSYFGPRTKAAVIKFQNKYTASVLTPVGLSVGTGFWGPSSRAHANSMSPSSGDTGGDTGDTGGDTGGTVGTGLT